MPEVPARKQQLWGKESLARNVSPSTLSPGEPGAPDERSPGAEPLQVGPPPTGVMSHSWEISPDADWLDTPRDRGKRIPEMMGEALG